MTNTVGQVLPISDQAKDNNIKLINSYVVFVYFIPLIKYF